jgi:hypothetical protein
MTHEDAMRHIKHMGEYVLPALREISDELELPGAFEVDPSTGAIVTGQQEPSAV